jgi:hypothetical protein
MSRKDVKLSAPVELDKHTITDVAFGLDFLCGYFFQGIDERGEVVIYLDTGSLWRVPRMYISRLLANCGLHAEAACVEMGIDPVDTMGAFDERVH